jgi:hypothetical protein
MSDYKPLPGYRTRREVAKVARVDIGSGNTLTWGQSFNGLRLMGFYYETLWDPWRAALGGYNAVDGFLYEFFFRQRSQQYRSGKEVDFDELSIAHYEIFAKLATKRLELALGNIRFLEMDMTVQDNAIVTLFEVCFPGLSGKARTFAEWVPGRTGAELFEMATFISRGMSLEVALNAKEQGVDLALMDALLGA